MAKLNTHAFFKATVGNLLFYRYRDIMVVRTISGFTKATRSTQPKYENCTRSAHEFGRVSSLCKQLRLTLKDILPKQNNLTIVNTLTKKMRQVLLFDTINERGERQLANALATEEGRQLLKGYEFNPDTTIALEYTFTQGAINLTNHGMVFPKNATRIGFRVHTLAFDFATGTNDLVSSEWLLEQKTTLSDAMVVAMPIQPNALGVVFTVLETQFYTYSKGTFLPIEQDGSKSLVVVAIE